MTGILRILTVCTHNRTRSVIAAALLEQYLTTAGVEHQVTSAGVNPAPEWLGHNEAVTQLANRGIIIDDEASQRVDAEAVRTADLILTAEPDHVVWIAGHWPDAYQRTFTLPEAAEMTRRLGLGGGFAPWVASLAASRPPARTYLERGAIPMILDPTGRPETVWEQVIASIEEDCRIIVDALV